MPFPPSNPSNPQHPIPAPEQEIAQHIVCPASPISTSQQQQQHRQEQETNPTNFLF